MRCSTCATTNVSERYVINIFIFIYVSACHSLNYDDGYLFNLEETPVMAENGV